MRRSCPGYYIQQETRLERVPYEEMTREEYDASLQKSKKDNSIEAIYN